MIDLEQRYPWIAWREPIPIKTPLASGLGCRICIARYGLHAEDVATLAQTQEEFDSHMAEFHA